MWPPTAAPVVTLLAIVLTRTHGAGIVEDHTLSWRAAGLEELLAAGHQGALPASLFAAVVAAAPHVQKQSSESFKFGKHNTWWLPLHDANGKRPAALSAIEAAVFALYDLDFGSAPTPIVGAEWWLQERAPTEDIGYHYDKDEAYASEHMTMRFPEVSTVTYLGAAGAPTLIFNQTTPDGNLEVPPLPVEAALVYPEANKHLLFRGNLQHGVSGALTLPSSGAHTRRTLLINWWRYAPMPPNCIPFEASRWSKLGLKLDDAARAKLAGGRHATARPVEWSPLAVDRAAARRVVVEVAPTDQLYFNFPSQDSMAAGNWIVEWGAGEAVGPLARLDLMHQRSLDAMFSDKRPKLFLILPSRDWRSGGNSNSRAQRTHWCNSLPRWIYGLSAAYGARLKFVLVEPRESANFMEQFGLQMADVPTAAIHDTARGGHKHLLKEKPRKATMWKFVQDFVGEGERPQKEEL